MPGGRPSDYKPEYCDMLIQHMASGLTKESFAGVVGVERKTLYNWIHNNPEFEQANGIGKSKELLFWEKMLIDVASGKMKGNIIGIIFKLKNIAPDLYAEKQVIEQTAQIEHKGDKVNVSLLSPETLQLIMKDYQKIKDAA